MADLKGAFWAGAEAGPPAEQLISAIRDAGLQPPQSVIFDGKIHRFKSEPNTTKLNGWYLAHDGQPKAGAFGCWKRGLTTAWREQWSGAADDDKTISQRRAERAAEDDRLHRIAVEVCQHIWGSCEPATDDHPYLVRKGVKAHGLRLTGDGRLVVPMHDAAGRIQSLQYIDQAGAKRFHSGARVAGAHAVIGDEVTNPVYICEGYATAATVYEVTGKAVAVAFSASNLPATAEAMRAALPTGELVIVADNDSSGKGIYHATQACAKVPGCRYVVPPVLGDANDLVAGGGDLLAVLEPQRADWLMHADEFSQRPAPINWLIKRWLQAGALCMVHGPSGCGKTFLVLDWACRVASEVGLWGVQAVRHGPVAYLAGEGHHGLRGRVAAWKLHHGQEYLDMWLSRSGCDLNQPNGLRQAQDALRALPSKPVLVIVDTLHRFLAGDENSAQDAKGMLDACAALQQEFGCCVLLVHHTGVADAAQHRARGSSAWRGALDIEVSLSPPVRDGDPIRAKQVKSKDAELADDVCVELHKVELPGWVDQDGEQVASAVAEITDTPPERRKARSLTEPERQAVGAYRIAAGLGRVDVDATGCFRGVHIDAWREQFYKISTGNTEDHKRQIFHRVRNSLRSKGMLWVDDDVYRLINDDSTSIQEDEWAGKHPSISRDSVTSA